MRNVYNSEDSILAVLLSRWFNIFLANMLSFGVKDITSGFIIGKKEYFNESPFKYSSYGDYFIFMLEDLYKNNVRCKELGYVCLTRIHGSSKTGTNYFQLVKRGIPYIRAVLKNEEKTMQQIKDNNDMLLAIILRYENNLKKKNIS